MTAKWECVVLPGAEKHEIIKELKNDQNATALVKLHIIGKVSVTDIKKLRLLILKKNQRELRKSFNALSTKYAATPEIFICVKKCI